MKSIADEMKEYQFFKDFSTEDLSFISGCGKIVVFDANEKVAQEGDAADWFYLVRSGRLAIETAIPGKPQLLNQTLVEGEICGWSWLFEPYKWTFDVTATEQTRVIAFDGKCLSKKCQEDYRLGYFFMRKFAEIMTSRLAHTRMQLMDIYGSK